jgi:hypothetical protein
MSSYRPCCYTFNNVYLDLQNCRYSIYTFDYILVFLACYYFLNTFTIKYPLNKFFRKLENTIWLLFFQYTPEICFYFAPVFHRVSDWIQHNFKKRNKIQCKHKIEIMGILWWMYLVWTNLSGLKKIMELWEHEI